jgi:hypothetical protein
MLILIYGQILRVKKKLPVKIKVNVNYLETSSIIENTKVTRSTKRIKTLQPKKEEQPLPKNTIQKFKKSLTIKTISPLLSLTLTTSTKYT